MSVTTSNTLLAESLEKPVLIADPDQDKKDLLLEELVEQGERGNAMAQFSLAKIFLSQGQTGKAMSYLTSAARQEDAQALYELAVIRYQGLQGTEASSEEGFKLMLKVAQCKGAKNTDLVSAAQFNIGRAYFQGFGVKQDPEEALKWWKICSNSDTESGVRAMNTLALFYSTPDYADKEKAFSWHVKAAENGHKDSMGTLGLLYMRGEGCLEDRELSLKWLKKSSDNGSIYGSGLLANYYYSTKMYSKAVEVAQSVCDDVAASRATKSQSVTSLISEGLATAHFIYAQCLFLGQGVTKDVDKAAIEYTKATQTNKVVTAQLHSKMMYGRL
ncbi:PREDICTED: LRP2-binding protein-like isoform X1 [Amphimedon queenslandica]|uniref:LRP2-binding protein n=2 Tax=Amphimedon queenslandica TaxID=400682 RepID=A0A1X7VJ62_AMPQE|nr:PREDICTED: LRP2-binding protein-like isoform X1 [Amphimedon queenslandica]|eukprot:XP_019848793.1 PREDICTED: LRP2-binding protein-like isoform X1 [Amphimedon queenslandica]